MQDKGLETSVTILKCYDILTHDPWTLWTEFKPVWVLSDCMVSHIPGTAGISYWFPADGRQKMTGSSPQIVRNALSGICQLMLWKSSQKVTSSRGSLPDAKPLPLLPVPPSHGCDLFLRLLKKLHRIVRDVLLVSYRSSVGKMEAP